MSDRRWTIQTGVGYGLGEHMTGGVAYGIYAGYRPHQVIELGLGITSATKQTLGRVSSQTQFHPGKNDAQIFVLPKKNPGRYVSSSAVAYTFSLGFSPIRIFSAESRHDLLLGAEFGLAHKGSAHHYVGTDLTSVNTYARSRFGFGARASYEYRINDVLGVGVTGRYNHIDNMVYGLGTLNIHL